MVRFILVALSVILFLIFSIPILIVEWLLGRSNPDKKNRQSLAIVQFMFRYLLWLAGVKVTVRGQENIPADTAVLYVGNHRSYFDILVGYTTVPGLTGFVAKKEMERYLLLRDWMRNVNCLFLDRKDIKAGLKAAFEKYGAIESVAIDTWGVDYVLMDGDKEIFPCYAYRDERTAAVTEEVHALMPFSEMYAKTGLMYAVFNSVYQFYCDKKSGRLEKATDYLMLPEYFSYKLTGVKAHEYTNATTTGLLNAKTHAFDEEIIGRLGLKKSLFAGKPENPGYVLGELKEEIQKEFVQEYV